MLNVWKTCHVELLTSFIFQGRITGIQPFYPPLVDKKCENEGGGGEKQGGGKWLNSNDFITIKKLHFCILYLDKWEKLSFVNFHLQIIWYSK